MNIALGALLIFLLLFPGILLRISYLNGPYSRKNIQSSLVDELVLSLVPSLILQGAGYLLITYCDWFSYRILLEPLYQLTIGANNPNYRPDFGIIETGLPLFLGYNTVMLLVAVALGKGARELVERFDLDIRVRWLRFNNDWYYLLTGRILNFPDWYGLGAGKVDKVQVDVVVETKEGSVLYCGLLEEFYLSKDGLDRICLSQVFRRRFDQDATQEADALTDRQFDNRYYEMPGDLFVVPYSQIRNINLTYYGKEIAETDSPSE